MTEKAVPDCLTCGSCCRDASDGRITVFESDLVRWKRDGRQDLLDKTVEGHFGERGFASTPEGACLHLGTGDGPHHCAIYETRGATCHKVQPGDAECLAYRRAKGFDEAEDAGFGELQAELYELTHRGNPGDACFYVRECEGMSVVEFGVGFGRLAELLVPVCKRFVGVENDAALLDRARTRMRELAGATATPRLVSGDMRTADLNEQFDRVIVPYNALSCMLTDRDLNATFEVIARHLRADGEALFDLYCADDWELDDGPDDEFESLFSIVSSAGTLDVQERCVWMPLQQRLHATYRYVGPGGPVGQYALPQRCLTPSDIRQGLTQAGLVLVETQHGFEKFEGDLMVFRARHA